MLTDKELTMYHARGKHVRVTRVNGKVINGFCEMFTQPYDNDPEVADIALKRGADEESGLIGITEPEIEKIEYLD